MPPVLAFAGGKRGNHREPAASYHLRHPHCATASPKADGMVEQPDGRSGSGSSAGGRGYSGRSLLEAMTGRQRRTSAFKYSATPSGVLA